MYFMKGKAKESNLNKVGTFEKVGILDVASYVPVLYILEVRKTNRCRTLREFRGVI